MIRDLKKMLQLKKAILPLILSLCNSTELVYVVSSSVHLLGMLFHSQQICYKLLENFTVGRPLSVNISSDPGFASHNYPTTAEQLKHNKFQILFL